VSSPRRNEPCHCGSGRRYKDCHGKLAATAPGVDALIRRALSLHQSGQADSAERDYRAVLELEPGNAIATHYMGLIAWDRGDRERAELQMRAGIAADASVPDFHNNLGLLLRDTRRLDEAIASFHRALEVDPSWFEAYSNLGLTLEAAGRWDEALAAYREALAREPRFAAAQQNLARVLLTRGDFAEGFARYRWRLPAQGVRKEAPDPNARPLPASLEGRELVLLSEQGLGDVLFFLRFVPELVRRGARLAFRGDPRLASILERTGLFALGIAETNAPEPDPGREAVFVGDLPWLLEAHDPAKFPKPLALAPQPERVARLRSVLEAQGPRPHVALTWRAGLHSTGPSRTQLKVIDPAILGATLRGIRATWISVQRLPAAGEREELAAATGALVRDFSATNDDLEEMLALLSLMDGYAGVSNANVYLRTGAGKPMQVLVAHPPEWRWGLEGPRSPWFSNVGVYRQRVDGDWTGAMRTLRERLTSREGS
jgi:tetratricopeptide (TPR) repeat protein